MIASLKNFIPDGVCLSCDGCCRFSSQKTAWAPFFAYDEITDLIDRDVVPSCLFTHSDIRKENGAQIDLEACADMYICPCFDDARDRCKIYPDRPLDCRLYPFVFCRRGQEVFLAVDKRCPYVERAESEDKIDSYARYLIDFSKTREFRDLLKNNRAFVQDYGEEIVYIKSLPELSNLLYGTSSFFPSA